MDTTVAFGNMAGKVWLTLKSGPKTLTQLQKSSGMTTREVGVGLGWLAREGKIALRGKGVQQRFELRE